jgi:hypothetical protein
MRIVISAGKKQAVLAEMVTAWLRRKGHQVCSYREEKTWENTCIKLSRLSASRGEDCIGEDRLPRVEHDWKAITECDAFIFLGSAGPEEMMELHAAIDAGREVIGYLGNDEENDELLDLPGTWSDESDVLWTALENLADREISGVPEPDAGQVLELLARIPGPEDYLGLNMFNIRRAAKFIGIPPESVEPMVEALVEMGLLEEVNRFGLDQAYVRGYRIAEFLEDFRRHMLLVERETGARRERETEEAPCQQNDGIETAAVLTVV